MAVNYAKRLPQDENNAVMTGVSTPFQALATLHSENAVTSSVTALNANCTVIEVATDNGPAAIRWSNQTNLTATSSVITAAATAAFDNVIPENTVRTFVVPRSSQALPNYSGIQNPSVVGRNTAEGLFSGVAVKSFGISSVMVTQY